MQTIQRRDHRLACEGLGNITVAALDLDMGDPVEMPIVLQGLDQEGPVVVVARPRPVTGAQGSRKYGARARLPKRVVSDVNDRRTVPVEPWRCLAIMTSPRPSNLPTSSCHLR